MSRRPAPARTPSCQIGATDVGSVGVGGRTAAWTWSPSNCSSVDGKSTEPPGVDDGEFNGTAETGVALSPPSHAPSHEASPNPPRFPISAPSVSDGGSRDSRASSVSRRRSPPLLVAQRRVPQQSNKRSNRHQWETKRFQQSKSRRADVATERRRMGNPLKKINRCFRRASSRGGSGSDCLPASCGSRTQNRESEQPGRRVSDPNGEMI